MNSQKYSDVLHNINQHEQYRNSCINLIASENCMSPATRAALATDLGNRYTVGQPGKRWYAGNQYYDAIESSAIATAKKLLHAQYVNVQPISGMVANLVAYSTLLKPGDLVMSLAVRNSGHYSHVKKGMLSLFGVRVEPLPFDEKKYTIDLEQAKAEIRKQKPNMVLVGTSEYLFPVPLKELRKVCDEVGATILYDAAHVSGLIVGQTFQDPLTEGADLLSLSTNKTLAAPDHGIVACNNPAYRAKIEHAIVPLFTSNHHAHHVAGLAITLAEFDVFGHDYAVQVIKNAKALARELYQLGITVLCPEQDFTESHTVLFDAKMPGTEAMKLLEDAQIITNSFQLPWNDENKTTGIRMGTNEMTRKGMKEKEIKEIARLIASCLFKRKPAEKIKREVVELVSNFRTVGYCFSINS